MNASDHVSYTTPHPPGIAYKSVLTNALSPHEFIQISRQHTVHVSLQTPFMVFNFVLIRFQKDSILCEQTPVLLLDFLFRGCHITYTDFLVQNTRLPEGEGGGSYNLHDDQCFNTEYYSSLALSQPKWRTSKTYINPGTVQRNLKVWKFSMSAF